MKLRQLYEARYAGYTNYGKIITDWLSSNDTEKRNGWKIDVSTTDEVKQIANDISQILNQEPEQESEWDLEGDSRFQIHDTIEVIWSWSTGNADIQLGAQITPDKKRVIKCDVMAYRFVL